MRFFVSVAVFALPIAVFPSADKKLPIEKSSNELVEVSAAVLLDRDEARQALGAEAPPNVVLVRVSLRTLSEKPVKIDRDDFALLSTNDGQRSTPYAPSQIAGGSTLVVGSQGTRGSMTGGGNGPIWGGIPGTGQRPRQLPGNGGGIGTGAGPSTATATVKSDENSQESPLLKALKEKIL